MATTKQLLMRVLQTKSPELFDGSEDEPVKVTNYDYMPFSQAVCETCGDDPEMMTIIYETKGGKQYGQTYDYFGLPNLLETLDKWDEEHS
jgi:hypothetical protein